MRWQFGTNFRKNDCYYGLDQNDTKKRKCAACQIRAMYWGIFQSSGVFSPTSVRAGQGIIFERFRVSDRPEFSAESGVCLNIIAVCKQFRKKDFAAHVGIIYRHRLMMNF